LRRRRYVLGRESLSGGSDIAAHEDDYVGEAVEEEHRRKRGQSPAWASEPQLRHGSLRLL